ncbi:MAG: hypothetical protein M3Q08_11100 [Pseudomonadota bacterium]|nr:hypothetical protein [Pseudomonadota bacterium]
MQPVAATGSRTVDEARHAYAEAMAVYTLGRPAPYTDQFLFELPAGDTTDPDEMIAGPMADQMAQKAMDIIAGEPGER